MRKLIIISLFIIGLSLSFASRTSEENSAPAVKPGPNPNQWALLIGVGDYPGNTVDLKYPADASSIKDLLISSAGFAEDHVRLLTDDIAGETRATKQNIFDAIDQYLAPRVQPGHEIIIFLAGHGIVNGVGTEAKLFTVSTLTSNRKKRSRARRSTWKRLIKLSALKASQFTLFYDACREDPSPGRGFKGNQLTDVTRESDPGPHPRATTANGRADQRGLLRLPGRRARFRASAPARRLYLLHPARPARACRPSRRARRGGPARISERKRSQMVAGRSGPFGQSQNPTMVATDVRGPVWSRASCLSGNARDDRRQRNTAQHFSRRRDNLDQRPASRARADSKDLPPNQYTVRAELPGFQLPRPGST